MKKIFMSLVAMFITVITVGFMYTTILQFKNKSALSEENVHKNQFVEDKNDVNIKGKSNNNSVKNKEDKNYRKENDNKFGKDESVKKVENNKERLNDENNSNEVVKNKNSKVFKVNKHTLLQNLPMKDKIKLLYMCKGLSTIDIGNIKGHMKSSNEVEASVEIFKILRQRLPKKDYNEIKKILDPYVDVDYIESNI